MLNIILRILVLCFLNIRWIYWKIEEKKADKEKPKTIQTQTRYQKVSQVFFFAVHYLTVIQVLGLPLFQFQQYNLFVQIVGVCIVILGVLISLLARKELRANWANGYEYQIKKDHEVITSGIYKFVRHPIYLGLGLSYVGLELVAQSYLWISLLGFFVAAYFQGKREEKILVEHFGNQYKKYMEKSKMLIPFVF